MKHSNKQTIFIGDKFDSKSYGTFTVVGYENAHNITIRFCKTGYETKTQSSAIRNGCLKDPLLPSVYGVGFIGVGIYQSTSEKRKHSDEYRTWKSMLSRCYSESQLKRRPTYRGCSVCIEWHNFQNFAEWYSRNHPNDGMKYDLDKDIIVSGNKIYSPETCKFVSASENMEKAIAKEYTFLSPDGVIVSIYNLNKFCRENGLDSSTMCAVNNGKIINHKGWRKGH